MEIGTITAILGALGAGAILTKLAEGIVQWATGKQGREQDAWDQRDEYRRKWDQEIKNRHKLEEHATDLRIIMKRAGIEPPPWPEYTTKN